MHVGRLKGEAKTRRQIREHRKQSQKQKTGDEKQEVEDRKWKAELLKSGCRRHKNENKTRSRRQEI